jgi:hypothetical protein
MALYDDLIHNHLAQTAAGRGGRTRREVLKYDGPLYGCYETPDAKRVLLVVSPPSIERAVPWLCSS